MEVTCADCGCLVDQGTVVQPCQEYPGCCCRELPTSQNERVGRGRGAWVTPQSGSEFAQAPPLAVSQWFNTNADITLDAVRGQVVAIEAFQMLCPGCVSHGLPQAQRIAATFAGEVTVLGLHTVFEHHEAMTPVSLYAFLYEYGITFPVGVDAHEEAGGVPITMARYGLRGTPSLILVDRAGRVRLHGFGRVDDLVVGRLLGRLIDEAPPVD